MKNILLWALGILLIIFMVWFTYWAAKTLSYNWWYESMVEETIREMVKKEALRGP